MTKEEIQELTLDEQYALLGILLIEVPPETIIDAINNLLDEDTRINIKYHISEDD